LDRGGGVLAAVYLFAGLSNVARSYEDLTSDPRAQWANDFSPAVVRFIGVVETLGALGLVVPPLVEMAETLTPLAATGLFIVAAGAIFTHARRGEPQQLVSNVLLALAAAFVAVGRFWIEPF
jgi:hypothetical protein